MPVDKQAQHNSKYSSSFHVGVMLAQTYPCLYRLGAQSCPHAMEMNIKLRNSRLQQDMTALKLVGFSYFHMYYKHGKLTHGKFSDVLFGSMNLSHRSL